MIRNYLKTALRNLWKHKSYSVINIFGLAIGMACVMLIMLYVRSELSYDQFHTNAEQIHRLNIQATNPQTGAVSQRAIGPFRLAKELRVDFPDFEYVMRVAPQFREMVSVGDVQYLEQDLAFVDPEVLQSFTFPLAQGDPSTALDNPFSMVVTRDVGRKYFNTEDPVGQTLRIRDRDFTITGILENIPKHSQFQYDMMVSMQCGEQVFSRIVLENWGEGYVETFVQIPPGVSPGTYQDRLDGFVEEKLQAWSAFSPKIVMQPLDEVYLHSREISSFADGGDITYVYVFSFIALFILIIACINFINLATARSSLRAREVGLRKVVGANRKQLIGQFLSESTILAFISLLLAVGICALAMPYFNVLAGKEMTVGAFLAGPMFAGMLAVTAFVGLVAGSYPAFILSGFQPIGTLGGRLNVGLRSGMMRRVLVSFQFAISIFLLVVTGIVYKQLSYCKNVKLGYDKDHVLVLGTPIELRARYDEFRSELMSHPQVVNAAASSRVPPGSLSSSLRARPEGIPEDQQKGMQTVWTDYDFIETMGFNIVAGRSFSRDFPADATSGFILNQAAVEDIGWTSETAIGKTFGSSEIVDWNAGQWQERDGQVIGVLENFHFESLKDQIVPTVYFIAPYMAWNYVIRIRPERINESIAFVENTWKQFNPDLPFEYTFVDENFAQLYQNEERQGRIFAVFSLLAIFIACLGLIGLASFTAERKKKEVGIRKVLGASSFNLVMLLSKEFTWLVVIAFCVAAPLAWFIMQNWLQDFAYQTTIGVVVFIAAGGLAILIAWLTVGLQTARTAYSNPVHALRHE